MQSARLWASLILAHTSSLLLLRTVDSQYAEGPFAGQRHQEQRRQQQQQQQQQNRHREKGAAGASSSSSSSSSSSTAAGAVVEPSCEELRAMWRYSKRQSRAAESTNELPVYRDPFSYNFWEAYPSRPPAASFRGDYAGPTRGRGVPVYGKLVHKAPSGGRTRNGGGGALERARPFEEVARLYGTVNRHPPSPRRRVGSYRLTGASDGGGGGFVNPKLPQTGSFQHLKELIIAERARELQEQRRAIEMAAKSDVEEEEEEQEEEVEEEPRNANFLGYREARSYGDLARQARFVADVSDLGRALTKADRYEREYMMVR